MMKCPDCGAAQDCSTLIVPGVNVYRCRTCQVFRVAGDTKMRVVRGFDGMQIVCELRSIAYDILDELRLNEILESDSDDPRWESWTV